MSNPVDEYLGLRSLYGQFATRIENLTREILPPDAPIAQLESRAKTPESLQSKLQTKKAGSLADVTDLAGVRVVTYFHDHVGLVADAIRENFEVIPEHSSDKATELDVQEFGYRSVHLVCRLHPRRRDLPEWKQFRGLVVEVQVRSVLQHAWALVSHKLDYKSVAEAPKELRRALFRLSAILELADEQFGRLRDESLRVSSEYNKSVIRGDLSMPLNLDSLREYVTLNVDPAVWRRYGVEAGMRDESRLDFVTDWYDRDSDTGLGRLLRALQNEEMETIQDFDGFLQKHRGQEVHSLREFLKREPKLAELWALPQDVLTAFVWATQVLRDAHHSDSTSPG